MASEQVSKWAVVQTGAYTTDGIVVPFVTPDGQRVPSVLFVDADHGRCVRKRKRLLLMASRHKQLGQGSQSDMVLATPVLGVVPITLDVPVKKPRPVPTPAANGTPAEVIPPVTADDIKADMASKRSRKHHEPAAA
jgi:hypothetical protein